MVITCGPLKKDHEVEPINLLLPGGVPVSVTLVADSLVIVADDALPDCEWPLIDNTAARRNNRKELFKSKNLLILLRFMLRKN